MYLDIIIAIPILWGMFKGFRRGLIIELCTLMALVLGIYGAAEFSDIAGEFLQAEFNTDPRLSNVLAFALVFVLIVIVVFIFGKTLEKVIKMVALGLFNKLLGMIFGGAKFLLIVSSLLFLINGFPITEKLLPDHWRQDSYLYEPAAAVAPKLFPVLKNQTWLQKIETKFEDIRKQVE
jgi:membrane protein required for colicin V production